MKISTENTLKNTTAIIDFHRTRLEHLTVILNLKEKLEAKLAPWKEEEKAKLAAIPEGSFTEYKNHTLTPQDEEVIPSYPPAYIIGAVNDEEPRIILERDTDMATVTLEEVSAEYMYSNPQGIFNLSIPDKAYRMQNYTTVSYLSYRIN